MTKKILSLLLPLALAGGLAPARAQSAAERAAEREIARREAAMPQGNEALARGKISMESRNYTQAHEDFRIAVTYLPDAVASGNGHDEAVAGFCESGLKLAEIRVQEGK